MKQNLFSYGNTKLVLSEKAYRIYSVTDPLDIEEIHFTLGRVGYIIHGVIESGILTADEVNDQILSLYEFPDLAIHGSNYLERKECLHNIAIDYQNYISVFNDYPYQLDMQDYFRTYGKRFGLLKEFDENAII